MYRHGLLSCLLGIGLTVLAPAAGRAADSLWIDPRCQPLPTDKLGPFAHLKDGSVLAIDRTAAFVSRDGGKTWSPPQPLFPAGTKIKVSDERALLRTRAGTL